VGRVSDLAVRQFFCYNLFIGWPRTIEEDAMYMILLVLNNPDQLDALLDAWEAAGIGGATVLHSAGMHRRKQKLSIPFRYVFQQPGMREEIGHFTIFAVVQHESEVENCLKATETVTGDLNLPNKGMFSAWPLGVVKGAWGKEPKI
jgi:nitrogen regulatory protein PII